MFFDFICLHFPEAKVLEVTKHIGGKIDEAKEFLEKRKRTSIWSYKELAQINSLFLPMMKLLHLIG